MTLNPLEEALLEVVAFLEDSDVSYAVVGGVASGVWGLVRTTVDVDVTVVLREERSKGFLRSALEHFSSRSEQPEQTLENSGLILLTSSNGIPVDLITASIDLQEAVVARAIEVEVADKTVRFATPEDVILLKLIAHRATDLHDIEWILRMQNETIDRQYLEQWVTELSGRMDDPLLVSRYRELCERAAEERDR